ncbi:hypothetical protein [Brevibacillus fortis]|uniref:hypothetical protein n=1 Tax=Brevibacillus fortis TaxID=2126352 RepID=UPI002692B5B6
MTARIGQFAKYIVLLFFAFLALYPIFLMIVSPLKSNLDILTSPLGLPSSFSLDNYIEVWEKVNLLDQSARLDGGNGFQVYFKIILPLMKPALATVGIVHLIGVWNDFFYPLIFVKSEELSTIPLGVLTLFGEYDTEWNMLFAS